VCDHTKQQMSFPPSAQLQLSLLPSLQPSILRSRHLSPALDASEMLVNDRRFFIYNFGRDAAKDKAAENGDFERDAAGDQAADTVNGDFGREAAEVDAATVNYIIPSPTCGPALQQSRSGFENDSRVY
jgi:hypothetical protein